MAIDDLSLSDSRAPYLAPAGSAIDSGLDKRQAGPDTAGPIAPAITHTKGIYRNRVTAKPIYLWGGGGWKGEGGGLKEKEQSKSMTDI